MSMKLSKPAYEELIAGDLEWLLKQPDTLERNHIEQIVKASIDYEYLRPSSLRDKVEAMRNNVLLEQEISCRIGDKFPEFFNMEGENYDVLHKLEDLGKEVLNQAIDDVLKLLD